VDIILFCVYQIYVEKTEGKGRLGTPRRRWEDDIKMDLREIRWGGVDYINLAQDRDQWRTVVNVVMNLRVQIKFREILE
jgi:hypothetical protein